MKGRTRVRDAETTQPISVVEAENVADEKRFRFIRGWLGPALLIGFGVGVGIALSVAVKSTPIGGAVGPGGGTQAGGPVANAPPQKVTEAALTSGNSGKDAGSYDTASIKPTPDTLVLAAVSNEVVGKDVHPKLSGAGLTWNEVQSVANSGRRVTLFRALGSKPSSGAVKVDYSESQHNSAWAISEFGGVDTSGSNGSGAIAQSSKSTASGAQNLKLTLAKFTDANNATFGAFVDNASSSSTSPGPGFTKVDEQNVEAVRQLTEWRPDNATTVDASSASKTDWSGIAVEIKAASSSGAGTTSGTGSRVSRTASQAIAGQAAIGGTQGSNGGSGSSDNTRGVTGNEIKVAANIVTDGVGASFLKDAIFGIRAVFNEANVQGINGRKINLTYRNDGWVAATGLQYIQNYIHDNYFALAVNPSSEGLNLAVQNGTIDNAGIPVIGTDGMLISQYRWPSNSSTPGLSKWVWPVASSTVSTMHIIADYGKSHYGAKTFGLVYDNQYKFGVEGAEAFQNQLRSLGVADSDVHVLGIEPGRTSYTNEANTFNASCGTDGSKCDLVAMLLDPSTAITWIGSGGAFGKIITNGPQTLFNHSFATQCVSKRRSLGNQDCHDFVVWTGYNPPVAGLENQPDVAKYVQDVHAVNGQADVENSFTEGAYLGARVFVQALKEAGRNLTRDALRQAMDTMTYSSGLSNNLVWTPSNHFANTTMHAFRINYSPNSGFTGWLDENTGWVQDSKVGQQ